ncbi:POK6 protein, partial [Climacteris rufus]|nr:POK6 protein [Climacteris rufus]
DGSAQLVELRAALTAFQRFSQEPFNLVTDSAYVADIAQRLGYSVLKKVGNADLLNLLQTLWCVIQDQVHPYYVLHVRSHTNLPGSIVEGSARAEKLANPEGLKALKIWQTDVTQVAEFGWLKYVHVTVDTCSSAMWASAHAGKKSHDVIAHWRQAFAILGIPSAVMTDNGPAYTLKEVRRFLQLWGVSHKFGIPHSLTGQAIVERAYGTLKWVLLQN